MKRSNVLILVIVFLFIMGLVFLNIEPVLTLDKTIVNIFYNIAHSLWIVKVVNWVSNYTIGSVFGLIVVVFYLLEKEKIRELGFFGIVCLLMLLINFTIKNCVMRLRPFEVMPEIANLSTSNMLDFYSFPSSHAMYSIFVAYFLSNTIWKNSRLKFLIYFLAILVCFSRLYLGVHYLSDVAAGALLGLIFAMLTISVMYKR